MHVQVTETDRVTYQEHLAGFLPPRIIDIHTHLWLRAHQVRSDFVPRGPTWPSRVAADNSAEDHAEGYRLMLPGHQVTPMVFGMPERNIDLDGNNAYVSRCAAERGWPALMVCPPEWSAQDLEQRARDGGFLGLKPYLNLAPEHIAAGDLTIYDFLPPQHLAAADAHGWIVMLHIPRSARLKDPLNLEHMLEIEQRYPNIRLIIAHIGRAYCAEDVGRAFETLAQSRRMCFDFSANTNGWVMEQLLRTVGPRRVLFGSDLPITRMRMRRICERGAYVNLVPPGLYGDVSDDSHMREVGAYEARQLTTFLYEELLAFRQAAEACELTPEDVAAVLHDNAARLIQDVQIRR